MGKIKTDLLLLPLNSLVANQQNCPLRYKNKKNQQKLLNLYQMYLTIKNTEKVNRRFWVRDIFMERQRLLQGAGNNLIKEMYENDEEKFFNFFRMSKDTFNEILAMVGPKIAKDGFIREAIHPAVRLQITLRYLASGDSMVSVQYMFRVGKSTVSNIIAETSQALWEALKDIVFMTPSPENWKKVAKQFEEKWNFKNCIGAVDGKHVVMQALPNSGSTNYNYKGSHSYVLMAIADANYKFIMVDIGGEGRQSDSGIFKDSEMGQGFEYNLHHLPPPENDLPYVLVGDEAFPLTEYLMRPYPRRTHLDMRKKVFNYRLSRARRVVENSFGLLTARWRIFRKPIIAGSSTIIRIIQATVCLHNFILMKNEDNSSESRYTKLNPNDLILHTNGLHALGRVGSNTFGRNVSRIRENYADYFFGPGAVEWQWQKVLQNDF